MAGVALAGVALAGVALAGSEKSRKAVFVTWGFIGATGKKSRHRAECRLNNGWPDTLSLIHISEPTRLL